MSQTKATKKGKLLSSFFVDKNAHIDITLVHCEQHHFHDMVVKVTNDWIHYEVINKTFSVIIVTVLSFEFKLKALSMFFMIFC